MEGQLLKQAFSCCLELQHPWLRYTQTPANPKDTDRSV